MATILSYYLTHFSDKMPQVTEILAIQVYITVSKLRVH